MTNKENLIELYEKNLRICRFKYPNDYAWPMSEFDQVMTRMKQAIDKMSFNKDSLAWRLTCKDLGIKHTYKSIKEYIEASK